MLWILFSVHGAGIGAAVAAGQRSMHAALRTAAIAPAATGVWAIWSVFTNAEPRVYEITWVEALDLVIRFRTDSLALADDRHRLGYWRTGLCLRNWLLLSWRHGWQQVCGIAARLLDLDAWACAC